MAPTIRIDDEVYGQLKRKAEPFVDTPNSVLRRLLDLDPADAQLVSTDESEPPGNGASAPNRLALATPPEVINPPAKRNAGSHSSSPKRSEGKVRAPAGSLLREEEYELPMLQALIELGGSAPSRAVIDLVGSKIKDRLTDLDKEKLNSGAIRWENRIQFVRLRLVQQGLMSKETGRGVWAISDQGRVRVENSESGVA